MILKRSPNKMHKIDEQANSDWENIPEDEKNLWQKIASKTKGLVTAGNAMTLTGTFFVMDGLRDIANHNNFSGFLKIMGGRAFDLGDGAIANKTGTKSNLGAGMDASADMIQMAATLPVLVKSGALPLEIAVVIGAPKVINTISAITAKARDIRLDTTSEGKIGTAATWIGIGAFALQSSLDQHFPGLMNTSLQAVGYLGTVGGAIFGVPATHDYAKNAFTTEQHHS